jgi:hypothetical protein
LSGHAGAWGKGNEGGQRLIRRGVQVDINIKVDTGLNKLGTDKMSQQTTQPLFVNQRLLFPPINPRSERARTRNVLLVTKEHTTRTTDKREGDEYEYTSVFSVYLFIFGYLIAYQPMEISDFPWLCL